MLMVTTAGLMTSLLKSQVIIREWCILLSLDTYEYNPLTGSGRVGGPGVSAPSPVLEWMDSIGLLTGPGAAVVKLAAEEHSSDGGLASNQNMEGSLAEESLETREFATFITANTC